jgi:hypothetical protein
MLDVGGQTLPAILDTGGHERLSARADVWAQLTAGGDLLIKREADEDIVSVKRAKYGEYVLDLPDMGKDVGDKTLITLGYPFLRNYRSIWNPANGTVTLQRKMQFDR